MTTQLAAQASLEAQSSYVLMAARAEELEHLNKELKAACEAGSRDSEELRQAIAAQDEVLGLVAHELRGPLTTILGNASILLSKRDVLEPSTVELALQDIQMDAKRLQRLIANLLVIAKPTQETPELPEPFDVFLVVAEVAEEHRRAYPHRLIHMTGEAKALVAAHRDCTEEIFSNLLSNAEKYSPPERPIEIRLLRAAGQVEISVLDRGPGIAEAEAQAIFRPFYRSPVTASRVMGLGLGLAVCKRLTETHGGHVWVTPREGGGSVFTLALLSATDANIGST